MEYRSLGRTGIKVSPLCLGAMMFGSWGNPDHEESSRIINMALDAGINFVDTADVYSAGESETIVGKAIKTRRESIVLATKFHAPMGDDPNQRGNSRRWIVREVEASLKRLQTDYIDLYQVHRPDPSADIEQTLSALSDLVHSGKVLAIGSSTFPAEEIVEAQWAAEKRGLERFMTEQPPYSIFARGVEASILPTCQRYGMGVISWSPLNGGWLSGKFRKGRQVDSVRAGRLPQAYDPSLPHNAAKLDLVDELDKIASNAGISLQVLAVGFVTKHPAISAAIIGPRTMEQLEGLLPALDVSLDQETMDAIDKLVVPGRNVAPGDAGYQTPALTSAWRRRRPS